MNCKFLFVATILLISLPFKGNDAAAPKKKSSSITVVGSVFCDTCFQRKFSTRSYFLPGVWVAIKCYTHGKPRGMAALGTNGQTNSHGVFRIELPFSFDSEKEIQTCNVHLLRSSSASCNVPSIKTKSHFAIKSKMNNNYVYSAGPLSFRPARFPALCHKDQRSRRRNTEWKPSRANSLKSSFSNSSKFEFPPIPAFPFPFPPFPPISLPIPPIPFWPPLPSPPSPPPPPPPNPGLPPLIPPLFPSPPPPPPNPIGGLPPLFPSPPPPPSPNPIGGLPPLFPPAPPPNPIGGLPPLFPPPPLIPLFPPPPPPLLPLFPPPPPNPIGGLPPLLQPPPPPNPIGGLPPLLPLSPPPPPPSPIGGLPPLFPLYPPPPPRLP